VSLDKPRRKSYLLLIPGCLDLVFNIGTLFLSLKQRNELMDSLGYGLFTIFAFFYGFAIIVLTLRKVRRHSKQLGEQYSNTEHRDLKWLYVAIAVIISIYGLAIFFAIFIDDFVTEIILSVFSLFITYWIAYHGLLQQVSVSLTSTNSDAQPIDIPVNETEKTVANTDAKHQQVVKAIGALLNAEKLYLNPELTIVDLAERIGEHPRLVSTSINRSCGENFNRFINKYRVEEARLRLLNSDVAHLNMEGIGIDAGFNSNSSFYTAFKKELNMTPLQYLKNSKS
jgi:AraC-like DNA-binding protein